MSNDKSTNGNGSLMKLLLAALLTANLGVGAYVASATMENRATLVKVDTQQTFILKEIQSFSQEQKEQNERLARLEKARP